MRHRRTRWLLLLTCLASFPRPAPGSLTPIPPRRLNAAGEQVFRNYFDLCGNLTNRVDGAGRATRRSYDALHRCTNTVYSDASTESFTFDAAGNLLTAKNVAATNTFAYDSMNRLTSSVSRVSSVTFTNRYRYDVGGLVTNVIYPDGKTVRYGFDADGRVTNVTDWAGHTWSITRDAAGRMTALSHPNGVSAAWTYDASHAVSSWSYSGAAGLPGRTITRDAVGQKTREDVTSGPMPVLTPDRRATNSFNAADRLTAAQVTSGTNAVGETYLYDPCGALTSVVRSVGASDVYTYDLAGRMTAASASNLTLSATYDALGNRIRTTVNGTGRLWVVDHTDPLKRPLMETTTNGVPIRYYVWGAGRLLAAIDADGTTRYAHTDDYGSIVALTSTNGAVLFTASYGPYGEAWGTTGTNVTPFGWLGGHGVFRPGAGSLHLTRFRAYDTAMKRFLSVDPIGLAGGGNLYAYAMGNPVALIDPDGRCGTQNRIDFNMPGYGDTQSYQIVGGNTRNLVVTDADVALYVAGEVTGLNTFSANYSYFGNVGDALNATYNPAYGAIAHGYEAGSGMGVSYYNSGQQLTTGQRVGAGVQSGINAVATVGIGLAGASIYSAATAPAQTTALSPYRVTGPGESFIRYESGNPAYTRITPTGGVTPGTYAAPASDGIVPLAQRPTVYNLPDSAIARPSVVPLNPPQGTPVIGPRPVAGGTGNEVIFWMGY